LDKTILWLSSCRQPFGHDKTKGGNVTTVTFVSKTCCVCSTTSRQAEMGVRGIVEPYDLDTRPTGAPRSSIYIWVQRCGTCGYCAPDISKGGEGVKKFVESTEYRQKLANRKLPEALNNFLCWSMIREYVGDYAAAGWAALYAAWVCDDDVNIRGRAAECRTLASRLFDQARAQGKNFSKGTEEEDLIRLDILRRCGRLDEASKLCGEMLAREGLSKRTMQIVTYQQELIEAKDVSKHTIGEALEDGD